jgi:DHA2 family metal-tetracycline-proton antiporter-like MFS transporter
MMFNVAIPDIALEFSLLPSEVSWVMTGYILLFGLGSLFYGRLADHRSVRELITVGLLLLNAGSLLGFFSGAYAMVIAARLTQAAGGAAIPALAMLVATKYMPTETRGRILGLIASTVALAAGIGPILGGFVAGTLNWRYLFLMTLVTILAIPSLRRMLPHDRREGSRFDYGGAFLAASGLSSLLFAFTRGSWLLIVSALALLSLFILHQERVHSPLVPPSIYRNRVFRNTVLVTFLAIGSTFAMMFMTPLMLSEINGSSVSTIGLVLFPGAMSAAFMGTAGGHLLDRKGSRFVVTCALLLAVAGYLLLSTFAGQRILFIAAVLIVGYVGFAFLQSSLPHAASGALPRELTGVGMGFYNLVFFMSGALSASVVGRILDVHTGTVCLNPLASCVPGWKYSNIYLGLAAVSTGALLLFLGTFKASRP